MENKGYSKLFAKPVKHEVVYTYTKLKDSFSFYKKVNWKTKLKKNFDNFIKKITSRATDLNVENFVENAKTEIVFGKKTKIAAEIENVFVSFLNPANPKEKNIVLRGANLKIYEGYVHAIIGESGSGKSVITSLLYGLTGNNAVIDYGKIKIFNHEVQEFSFDDWERKKIRGLIVSAVFQNPMSILDPTMKVGKQITEGLLLNKLVKSKKEANDLALKYLQMTKINNPEKVMKSYPHELSGGMIQRVAIAAVMSLKPKILVMDEPTTALDPTVQSLVLDIVREFQENLKIAIVFITHDLGVVASISDFISIMYAGQIIETGTKEEILEHPQHPYSWGLIMSMPDFNHGEKLVAIKGNVPSYLNDIKGDAFAIRNEYALGRDFLEEPDVYQISATHFVKSSLLDEKAPEYQAPKIIEKMWKKYYQKLNQINNLKREN